MFTPLKKLSLILGDEESPVAYERTAIVDGITGNDSTAQLNSDTLRFSSVYYAVAALMTAYNGMATTIRLASDADGNSSADIENLLWTGLTIMSHDGTARNLTGTTSFGQYENALLTLDKVSIEHLLKAPHTQGYSRTAGTITGVTGSETIELLTLDSDTVPGADGLEGSPGADATGSVGNNGSDGDPPLEGSEGESVGSYGSPGGDGVNGVYAWDVNLLGAGTIVTLNARSLSAGGAGGVGGVSGVITGGAGGAGGDSTASAYQDGAAGGDGGSADGFAGYGGNGGNGGNGGIINMWLGSWSITGYDISGSLGGAAGIGGIAGTATAGLGGAGGAGEAGGENGPDGAAGTVTQTDGADGTAGTAGTDGMLNV